MEQYENVLTVEVETVADQRLPLVVEISQMCGQFPVSAGQYDLQAASLQGKGYLMISPSWQHDGWVSSLTREFCRCSLWLAPGRGMDGIRAWAFGSDATRHALRVDYSPSTIVVQEGDAAHFVGRGGETLGRICAHSGYTGYIRVAEATKEEGVHVLPFTTRFGERALKAVFSRCWWRYKGELIFAPPDVRFCRAWYTKYDRSDNPVQMAVGSGHRSNCLTRKEIESLEAGHDPAPRMSVFPGRIFMSPEQVRQLWLVIVTKPGYAEARTEL